jgi:hypothetical protein
MYGASRAATCSEMDEETLVTNFSSIWVTDLGKVYRT